MARDSRTIGKFHLEGIPPAPRGLPQIEVAFDIDANGIIHVSAKDLGTNKEQKITITASSGLTDADIKKMVKDAEEHADEDRDQREQVETGNAADNAAYQAEKLLREQGDKIAADKRAKVENAIESLRSAIKSGGTPDIKARMEDLNEEMQAVSLDLYGQTRTQQAHDPAQDAAGGEAHGPGERKDAEGDVIDADFEEVNK
jgi:molecular chaperone DnaK